MILENDILAIFKKVEFNMKEMARSSSIDYFLLPYIYTLSLTVNARVSRINKVVN